jgi:hypothetical protein
MDKDISDLLYGLDVVLAMCVSAVIVGVYKIIKWFRDHG